MNYSLVGTIANQPGRGHVAIRVHLKKDPINCIIMMVSWYTHFSIQSGVNTGWHEAYTKKYPESLSLNNLNY